MASVGHRHDEHGRSVFRVFAPGKRSLAVVLIGRNEGSDSSDRIPLTADAHGHWHGSTAARHACRTARSTNWRSMGNGSPTRPRATSRRACTGRRWCARSSPRTARAGAA